VPVDLGEVVETAQEWIFATAQRKSLKLLVEIEPLAGAVMGDAGRLQQIVANLLTNAVKFTPPKGTVTLRLSSSGGIARLQVQDTGIGIDTAFLSNIFDRFSQVDASNTRSNSGLGLGLSIVKHLVELHNGTIRAESAGVGKGATFTVEFPLIASPPALEELPGIATREGLARLRSQTKVGIAPLRGLRILLVDDDAGSREAVGTILQLAQAVVHVAASAEEGIAALAAFHPDALISDISMPGEDGYSFIRRVRTLPPGDGGEVRALALTALAGDADVREALDAGFQLHVAKPVGIDRLTAAVVELMATSESHSA
jgi:CheY-like chemotaxis protein